MWTIVNKYIKPILEMELFAVTRNWVASHERNFDVALRRFTALIEFYAGVL